MNPIKSMIIKDLTINNTYLKTDTHVWKHNESSNFDEIEYKNQHYKIPKGHLITLPVPPPSKEQLKKIDPCFTLPQEHFEQIYKSDKYFTILKCKQHGKTFLKDWRGGSLIYSILIYIKDPCDNFDNLWKKYHNLSLDYLRYLGISN